jgi:carboxymethylenebutenolidase
MQQKKADDFHPEVLRLYDKYAHGMIDRRGFLSGAAKYAIGGMSASMLLDALSPRFAQAQQVAQDDKRIKAQYVEYPSPEGHGKMRGYLAAPTAAAGKRPAVLVLHENRGLNPHAEDIARRLSLEGFLAFAPDALSPLGGYPGDEDKGRDLFAKLDEAKLQHDFIAAAKFLQSHPASNGKTGVVGFCYGGTVANMLATRLPTLNAVVAFYGGAPKTEDVAKIKAPLQLHFAGKDERVNAGWPAYESALKAAGVNYSTFLYPDVNHAFNNDTTPRYDQAAAKLAWQRTIEFLKKHLNG